MKVLSGFLGAVLVAAMIAVVPTAQASTSDELASVELNGVRVAAVGYWPAPPEGWGCNSYLYSYSGRPESGSYTLTLIDAISKAPLGYGFEGGQGEFGPSGVEEFLVCGDESVPRLRLRLVEHSADGDSRVAESQDFTWGGTPPVIGTLAEGSGRAELGGEFIRTTGIWPAPQGEFNCVNLLVSGRAFARGSSYSGTWFSLIDAESRRQLATGFLPFTESGQPEALSALDGCRDPDTRELPRALVLQLLTSNGLAIGQPFTWSSEAQEPPPVTALPFSASTGTFAVSSRGTWPAPSSSPPLSTFGWRGSYLFDYRGLGENASADIRLIDPVTREVLGWSTLRRSTWGSSSPAEATDAFNLYGSDGIDLDRPFVIQAQVSSDGGGSTLVETVPYAWDSGPIPAPVGVRPPASVTLGSLTVSTEGSWTIPRLGEERSVTFTGLPNDSPDLSVSLVDVTTREVFAFGSTLGSTYSDRGTITMAVSARVTSDTRFALQISSRGLGFAESEPLRWFTPPSKPTEPLAVAATIDPGDTSATVTWSPPASDGDSPITRYAVVSQPSTPGCIWTSGPLQCQVGGLAEGQTYLFYVYAYNAVGTSNASAAASVTVPRPTPPATVPSAVQGLTAKPVKAKGRLTVSWRAPASDGGSPVTSYEYRVGNTAWKSTTSLRVNLTGLRSKRAVTISVRAVNDVGPGAVATARATPR